jgi:hypothetical protein
LLRSSGAGIVQDPVQIESAAMMLKEKLDDETCKNHIALRATLRKNSSIEGSLQKLCHVLENTQYE